MSLVRAFANVNTYDHTHEHTYEHTRTENGAVKETKKNSAQMATTTINSIQNNYNSNRAAAAAIPATAKEKR